MGKNAKLLYDGQILTQGGEIKKQEILITDGRIAQVMPEISDLPADIERIDCDGKTVAPGLIDTHVHGALGRNFMEGTPDAIAAISGFMVKGGTTSCLATTMSADCDKTERALCGLRDACRDTVPGQVEILGIHLEGPFINVINRGAHPENSVRFATEPELKMIKSAAQETLKVVTLAPEIPYAMEAIEFFIKMGSRVSIGHTTADFKQTQAALIAGASRATHFFNAMPQIHHRQPGAVVALLLDPSVFLELTADGNHFALPIFEMILRVAEPARCILITDGVDVRGLGDGCFQRWEGTGVIVRDGEAKTQRGSLAGSMISQCDAIANLVSSGSVSTENALRMASEYPAKSVGVFDRKGSISPGKDADLVVFNPDFSVSMTIIRGDIAYREDV